MAVRIARQAEAIGCAIAALGLTLGFALASAAGDGQPSVPPPPAPALSPSCQAPAADIATPAPLPHLQADLAAKRTIRVLAIGSSSTVGLGASSPTLNYPAQLELILEQTFKGLDVVTINRGVSGEVAAATADRLKTLVGLERPDLVLWQVGTNDALMRVGIDDFRATVVDTLRWLKEHEIDTVLVGLQYTLKVAKDEHYRAIRMALRDIAQSEGVLLVRRYEAMEFIEKAKAGPLLAGDELHLNDLGYRCMAEHIARAMVVSAFFKGTGTPRVGRTLP
ncbi:SGNH/GDSL hydrolase family protein [Enterovirga sp.]|jgi:acyl-CoA thioesterase-1|uniref:SGNH/GDSL hydrolase family protein n=1 Tax=Enterovirga sp. TaxID=2026350 RepID=UPI00262AD127|nr:SGNH/GDSL hydrolase family protein [Enterovirga sp.]